MARTSCPTAEVAPERVLVHTWQVSPFGQAGLLPVYVLSTRVSPAGSSISFSTPEAVKL